jgi:hypothetical protein
MLKITQFLIINAVEPASGTKPFVQTEANYAEETICWRPWRLLGARGFEESEAHTKDPQALSRMKLNQLNCSTSGCHNIIHNVGQLKEATFWKEPAK